MSDFLKRHRKKFLTAGILSAGIYYAYTFASSKLREISNKAIDERTAKDNLKRRFKQNQQDATFNALAFLPEITEHILDALKVESITAELQAQKQGRSATTSGIGEDDNASIRSGYSEITHSTIGRRSKLDLWNDVKITSITRVLSLYYCISLLVILTRIQLNLIGRGSYVASVMSVVNDDGEASITLQDNGLEDNVNSELNRQYMTFIWYLLNRGWADIVSRVQRAVEDIFSRLQVKEEVTLSQMRLLVSRVRSIIEYDDAGSTHNDWVRYALPKKQDELFVLNQGGQDLTEVKPELRVLLDETAKEIGSQESALLITRCLDIGVAQLLEVKLKAAFKEREKLRVANILPVLTREAHIVGTSEPNEYIEAINNINELDGFSARLFTSFGIESSA